MTTKLDMTAMYGAHDAPRRELELPARTAAGVDDDPRRILGAAVGWELFKKSLHVHLTKPMAMYAQTALVRRCGRPNDPDDHELLRTLSSTDSFNEGRLPCPPPVLTVLTRRKRYGS